MGMKDESEGAWYILFTNPRQESRAVSNLAAWGIEAFNPLFRRGRRNEFSGSVTFALQPLFPRYVFARFDAVRFKHKVANTRGVKNIVCFGEGPVPIEVIDAVRCRSDGAGVVALADDLRMGDVVQVESPTLGRFLAVFEKGLPDAERVSLLLTTANFQCRVEVQRAFVHKSVS
jgi:transcription antitermination factor NusG